jgi:hypothetical protein
MVFAADLDPTYRQQIEQWRAERLARLTAPDGWLTLIALDWLKPGVNTVGSAADCDVRLPKLPPRLGTITLENDRARWVPAAGVAVTIDGVPGAAELLDDRHPHPTVVAWGTVQFYLIRRGDRLGVRAKDSAAPTRTGFAGLDYFDIDPSWRIEAKWEPYDPPHTVEQPNVLGETEKVLVPGAAVFEREGRIIRVEPVIETPGDRALFLVFADRTSGQESYGAARFVYTEPPHDGTILIDFNRAYNPPCAFTPFATCPLPTAQNRLDVRVTAGEKKYRGAHP